MKDIQHGTGDLSPEELEATLRTVVQEYAIMSHREFHPVVALRQLLLAIKRVFTGKEQAKLECERIANSGYFDPAWYLQQNPEVQALRLDPLKHFQRHGAHEGRSPSPRFDTLAWLTKRPWLIGQHRNPFLDYLDHLDYLATLPPVEEDLPPKGEPAQVYGQFLQGAVSVSGSFVPLSEHHLTETPRIRAIALYLPQFHPIKENDRWWGKGFTEWTNVSKAVPQFEGHYQPRLPGELGFYDLRVAEVQERQVELARQYGVSAFCFHYYWFSGRKRLLERPLNQYVLNPNIDFPFCLCWANENWTRRWDGREDDILMEQRHLPEDDLEFIEDVAPLLKDPRYVKVNGKPLLIVYRVTQLPDPMRTVNVWRQYCRDNGIGELHLVCAQAFGAGDPREYGFDAAMEYPPHQLQAAEITDQVKVVNADFQGHVFDYSSAVDSQLSRAEPDYLLYRSVFPSWDNEARKPGRGYVFNDSSPSLYRQWLNGVCVTTDDRSNADEKIVFINAWNEWAEGAYLEPDRRYGYAYLEATQHALARFPGVSRVSHDRAVERLSAAKRRHNTAVVLHLFYPDLWAEFARSLTHLKGEYDLYLTVPDDVDESHYAHVLRDVPTATLLPFPNRGRDISPFLTVLNVLHALGYSQVCKLHAKRSLHRGDGDFWRREMLEKLLGTSPESCDAIVQAFERDEGLGMVGPDGHWLTYRQYGGISNERQLCRLATQLQIGEIEPNTLKFFAGSMFWCRPQALSALAVNIRPGDFDVEVGQIDGTLAHDLERLMAAACIAAGFRVASNRDLGQAPTVVRDYPYAQPRISASADKAVEQAAEYGDPGARQEPERNTK